MAQSVTRRIERSLTASAGFRSRPTDKASICGNHQGQRSCEIAPKGRTHDCKRPVLLTKKALASWGPSTHEAASSGLLFLGQTIGRGWRMIIGSGNVRPQPRYPFRTALNGRPTAEPRAGQLNDGHRIIGVHVRPHCIADSFGVAVRIDEPNRVL